MRFIDVEAMSCVVVRRPRMTLQTGFGKVDSIARTSCDADVAELTRPICTSEEQTGAVIVAVGYRVPTVDNRQIIYDGGGIDHVSLESVTSVVQSPRVANVNATGVDADCMVAKPRSFCPNSTRITDFQIVKDCI